MNPSEKDLLEKTYELSKENNNILRGIRSSNRWSMFFRILYWIIIIGIAVGAFYYVQPYIDMVLKAYGSIKGDLNNAKSVVDTASKALNSLPK